MTFLDAVITSFRGIYLPNGTPLRSNQLATPRLNEQQVLMVDASGGGGGMVVEQGDGNPAVIAWYVQGHDTPGDANPNPTNAVPVAGYNMAWDGANWIRFRSRPWVAAAGAEVASVAALDTVAQLVASDGANVQRVLATTGGALTIGSGAKGASAAQNVTSTSLGADHQALDVAVASGAKGATAPAVVTSTAVDANHQGLDVTLAAGGKGATLPATVTSTNVSADRQGVDVAVAAGAKGATPAAVVTSTSLGVDHQGIDITAGAGAKGATPAAVVTSTAVDANHQGLDVTLAAGGKGATLPATVTSTNVSADRQGVDVAVAAGAKGATPAAVVTSTSLGVDHQGIDITAGAGAKGATPAAVVTSTAVDANHQGLDVTLAAGGKGATGAATVTSTSLDANHQGVDVTLGAGSKGTTSAAVVTSTQADADLNHQGLDVVQNAPNIATYMASTNGVLDPGTVAGSTISLAYLWHPAANTRRTRILSISVTFEGGNTVALGGGVTIFGNFITAEAAPAGGTAQTTNPVDRADAASTLTFRTNANVPTRVAGALITWVAASRGWLAFEWSWKDLGKPITLRANVAEGFEIRLLLNSAFSVGPNFTCTMMWTEEP